MPVIRCKTCKGTGRVEEKEPWFPLQGSCVEDLRRLERDIAHGLYRIDYVTCPNCGGSGCKWVESERTDE